MVGHEIIGPIFIRTARGRSLDHKTSEIGLFSRNEKLSRVNKMYRFENCQSLSRVVHLRPTSAT